MSHVRRARALAWLSSLLVTCVVSQPALAACQWQQIRTPDPGRAVNELNGEEALSLGNGWAVGDAGFHGKPNGSFEDIVDHWNGSSWSAQSLGSAPFTQLLGVSGSERDNVLAVGVATSSTDPITAQPIAFRFDGATWNATTVQFPGSWAPGRFNAVAGIGHSNGWAVGYLTTSSGPQQLIEHWNGTKWSSFATPPVNGQSDLLSVSAINRNNVWALGIWSSGGQSGTMIEHFDGLAWTVSLNTTACLTTLTAFASNDVFAVGACGGLTAIEFFDGSTWTQQPGPSVDPSTVILGIAARDIDAVTAVGRIPATGNAFMMFFNGSAWTQVAVPNVNGDVRSLNAVAPDPGTNEFWSVGTSQPTTGPSRQLALKYFC